MESMFICIDHFDILLIGSCTQVPEKTLQFSGLLGGWIGGFWAMDKFRHKTRKQAFLGPYYACVAGNVALSGGLAYLVMGGEGSKQALNTFLRSESGKMIKREIMRRLKRFR